MTSRVKRAFYVSWQYFTNKVMDYVIINLIQLETILIFFGTFFLKLKNDINYPKKAGFSIRY